MEEADRRKLFQQFDNICRGVVLSSVVAAVVQSGLAGIGFSLVGVERIWLQAIVTMFYSLIPSLGAAFAWIGVAAVPRLEQRYELAAFFYALRNVVRQRLLDDGAAVRDSHALASAGTAPQDSVPEGAA